MDVVFNCILLARHVERITLFTDVWLFIDISLFILSICAFRAYELMYIENLRILLIQE